MSVQNLISKLTGVMMVLFTCLFYVSGSMDALTAVVMVISAFIVNASLETAGNYSALLRVVDVSVDRAQEILDTPQMDISGEQITPQTTDIAASDIVFSYDRRRIIDGVTLRIPERTTTAIVGPSGGGKTTLVNLLARFCKRGIGQYPARLSGGFQSPTEINASGGLQTCAVEGAYASRTSQQER